jgi:hypothetical protein
MFNEIAGDRCYFLCLRENAPSRAKGNLGHNIFPPLMLSNPNIRKPFFFTLVTIP